MATPAHLDRLRHEVASAAQRLQATSPLPDRPQPLPGDLYVLGTASDAPVEWLVIREHPDDPELVLVAPVDEFPLVGAADQILSSDSVDRPLVVRCGEACWMPVTACPGRLRAGLLPAEVVRQVRRHLAAAARGGLPTTQSDLSDADPEYMAWMDRVARAREVLQSRADLLAEPEGTIIPFGRFSLAQNSGPEAGTPYTLAASPGGILAELGQVLADQGPRYWECEVAGGGRLRLTADSDGMRFAWVGPVGTVPPRLAVVGPVGQLDAEWRSGNEPGHHYAPELFPWTEGQVTYTVEGGIDAPQTWTVRL